ncbi:PCMD domain-containing protein [Dysgonomonas sp. 511]|uniref:PCMD domain-containing protein n=1 Tax=Dysgonomonas sp. 511 TaxID=2302930 RepID=UPI0013D36B20|nr:PCMD domain-containing protein [Dysgonomonas sp. 511]NDV79380.1 hypothetical protein [Dysgonomonas sp. 511]
MKIKLLFLLIISYFFTSCIKDEARNSEADILSFELPDEVTFGEAMISNKQVILFVNKGADITSISPKIEVTPGAVVTPSPDVNYDFTNNLKFTVTSEDKQYSKTYEVSVFENDYYFDFEEWTNWEVPPKETNYPELKGGLWKSGNSGIFLSGERNNFPTRSTEDSRFGEKAILLETQKGKVIWNNFYSILSGSIYYGSFGLVMSDPPKGVRFGHPHPIEKGRPIRFTGYYKYKAGETFLNSVGEEEKDRTDECTIRAFLYSMPKNLSGSALTNALLTGKDDILNSDRVVAIADLKDCTDREGYTYFNLSFEYKGKIDYDEYDYRFAIVFSSSKYGDFYEGAPGSRLYIDEVKVTCEDFDN